MNRIYISIAGYRDPLLRQTIVDAYTKAHLKDRLVFGVVDQSYEREFLNPDLMEFRKQIRYFRVDPYQARGACFARHLAQTLWAGEEYFLQIDSHTQFDEGWDERMVTAYKLLNEWHRKPLITCYPRGFVAENNNTDTLVKKDISGLLTLVADPDNAFKKDEDMYVGAKAKIIDSELPVHGFLLSANCLFTGGSFCEEVPYDPYLYFSGEEHSLAIRAWTRGYNIFHMPIVPIYHHYGRDYRTPVWSDKELENQRTEKWWEIDRRSKQRLGSVCRGEINNVYGLGRERNVFDYVKFSGINYYTRTLMPHALTGDGIFDRDHRKPI